MPTKTKTPVKKPLPENVYARRDAKGRLRLSATIPRGMTAKDFSTHSTYTQISTALEQTQISYQKGKETAASYQPAAAMILPTRSKKKLISILADFVHQHESLFADPRNNNKELIAFAKAMASALKAEVTKAKA